MPNLCPFNYDIGLMSSDNLKILTAGFLVACSPVKRCVPSLDISMACTYAFPIKYFSCLFSLYE
jgi:hypothetical protein